MCVVLAFCVIERGPSSGREDGVDGRMEGAMERWGVVRVGGGARGKEEGKTCRLTCVPLLPLALLVLIPCPGDVLPMCVSVPVNVQWMRWAM